MTTAADRPPITGPERRIFRVTELRVTGKAGEKRGLQGYAATYDNLSDPIGGGYWSFREIIRPGAFSAAFKSGADVRCLFNHDANWILGRTRSKTMRLEDRSQGLWFDCDVPAGPMAQHVADAVERGDVNGCSFSFRTLRDRWTFSSKDEEMDQRELLEVEIDDVGPVTFPAYPDTEVDVRSVKALYDHTRSIRPDVMAMAAARLRLASSI
jgi:HK97 family phage prohead protease